MADNRYGDSIDEPLEDEDESLEDNSSEGGDSGSTGDGSTGSFADRFQKKTSPAALKPKDPKSIKPKPKEDDGTGFLGKVAKSKPIPGKNFGDYIYCEERKNWYKIILKDAGIKVKRLPDGQRKRVRVKKRVRGYLSPKGLMAAWAKYQNEKQANTSFEKKAKQGLSRYLFTVRGQDREWDAWHIVLVEPKKMAEFRRKIDSGSIDVAKFGKVLESGWGKDPPESTIARIKKEYGPDDE